MTTNDKANKFAAYHGYDRAEFLCRWKNYEVYEPITKKERITGLPYKILIRDGDVRLSTINETFDIMDECDTYLERG